MNSNSLSKLFSPAIHAFALTICCSEKLILILQTQVVEQAILNPNHSGGGVGEKISFSKCEMKSSKRRAAGSVTEEPCDGQRCAAKWVSGAQIQIIPCRSGPSGLVSVAR